MAFFGQASPASAPGAPGQIRASMNKFPPNPDTAAIGQGMGRMAGQVANPPAQGSVDPGFNQPWHDISGGMSTGDGPMNGGGLMGWGGMRPPPSVGQPGYNQFDPSMNPLAATPNGQGGGYNGPAPDGSTGANRPGMQYRADRRAGQPGKQGGPGAEMPSYANAPQLTAQQMRTATPL